MVFLYYAKCQIRSRCGPQILYYFNKKCHFHRRSTPDANFVPEKSLEILKYCIDYVKRQYVTMRPKYIEQNFWVVQFKKKIRIPLLYNLYLYSKNNFVYSRHFHKKNYFMDVICLEYANCKI